MPEGGATTPFALYGCMSLRRGSRTITGDRNWPRISKLNTSDDILLGTIC